MARNEFNQDEVEKLLLRCHRRCCICHRFCGVKIEVDHIESASMDSSGAISNAIPLCFECHAEVHHYNPEHPKGRRFRGSELKAHRDQWLQLCRERPEMFLHALPAPEAGSLERLLSELEFNLTVSHTNHPGGSFEMIQFRRAIADGTLTWIDDGLKRSIHQAYVAVSYANGIAEGFAGRSQTESAALATIRAATKPIEQAIERLRTAL